MRWPQLRQRPRRKSHESSGTLSQGRIGGSQPGQCDPGATRDSPRGRRYATTLRKDPITSPNGAAKASSMLALEGFSEGLSGPCAVAPAIREQIGVPGRLLEALKGERRARRPASRTAELRFDYQLPLAGQPPWPVRVHARVTPDEFLTMSNLWAPPVVALETASTVYELAVAPATTETCPAAVPYARPVDPSAVEVSQFT